MGNNNNSKHGTKKQAAVRNPLTAMRRPWKRSLTEERGGRGSWSWSCSWRGATRCEWRQSRVQMNAHLKLSPNPFTIDAVQSGRYLPHAAHCCTRMCPCQQDEQLQTTTYSPLALLLLLLCSFSFFFGLWQYVCVCPGLGARLHSLSARCEGHRLVLGFLLLSALPRQCSPTAQQL